MSNKDLNLIKILVGFAMIVFGIIAAVFEKEPKDARPLIVFCTGLIILFSYTSKNKP